MELKINQIIILLLITLAFSGCVGTESESVLDLYSSMPLGISPTDIFSPSGKQFPVAEYPVKYASVNGIDIGYREFGSGESLLIIMPFATRMDMYNSTFFKYLANDYRVIIFDNRGMGYSSSDHGPISIPILVDDTADLMDALELDSAHIYGSSMGATIAQELTLAHPDKIEKLILSSTTYSLDVPQTEKLKSILQYRASDPNTDPVIREYAKGNLEWNGTYERLPEIQNRVLVLASGEDELTPPELSVKFAERVPDAQLVRFEGTGHVGGQELPEEYANEILSFLAAS